MNESETKLEENKRRKPASNHPWKTAVKSDVHKWAHEQSKISELAIKQPNKFQKRS